MRDLRVNRGAAGALVFASMLGMTTAASAQNAPAPARAEPAPPAVAPQPPAPPPGPAPAPASAAPGAAPGYAYPPPPGYPYAYPYPYPPYGYARAMRVPESVPYQGGPVPRGYHVEERPRRGLIIAGALVLGIPWAIGVSVISGENYPNSSGWLLVPGLGPWITLAARHDSRCSGSSSCIDDGVNAATRTLLVLDGLMQTSGAAMLIVGLASKNKVVTRDFVGSLRFAPAPLGKQGYGGFVTGQF